MSGTSRFVSAGTSEAPIENDEWKQATQEIEDKRRKKAQEGIQDNGKSLYETLQANKAAKQEAYEESIKLKNQFRALDEDEAAFLDSVLESTRQKDDEIRRETKEQLEAFRKHRAEAEKAAAGVDAVPEEDQVIWSTKKRKKAPEKTALFGKVKIRRTSSGTKVKEDGAPGTNVGEDADFVSKTEPRTTKSTGMTPSTTAAPTKQSPAMKPKAAGLGLAYDSSDEDD